jgi:hypothetical protein
MIDAHLLATVETWSTALDVSFFIIGRKDY